MPPLIRSRLVLLVLGGLGLLAPGCPPPQPPPGPGGDPPPPGFSLRDVAGVDHHPFADPAAKAVALAFALADCPIANGYAPEINRLCAAYGPRGVRFFLAQVDEGLGGRAAAARPRVRLRLPGGAGRGGAPWCGGRAPARCRRRRCPGPAAGGSTSGASTTCTPTWANGGPGRRRSTSATPSTRCWPAAPCPGR